MQKLFIKNSGVFGNVDLNSAVDKLESEVSRAKVSIGKADEAIQKYKITEEHWAAADRAEQGFNRLLNRITIKPARSFKSPESQITLLAVSGALFMIISTLGLYLYTKDSIDK